MTKSLSLKSISTGLILGVLTRQVFEWVQDKRHLSKIMFDLVKVDFKNEKLQADLIIVNYSGSASNFSAKKIAAYQGNKLVAAGDVNDNVFLLSNNQVLFFDQVILDIKEKIDPNTAINYKFIANADGFQIDVKPFESNKYGAIYDPGRSQTYKEMIG